MPQLLTALERHPDHAAVTANCARCLWRLALLADNKLALMPALPFLRAALDRHPGSTSVKGAIRALR